MIGPPDDVQHLVLGLDGHRVDDAIEPGKNDDLRAQLVVGQVEPVD